MGLSREQKERRLIAEQAAQWASDLHEAAESDEQRLLAWLKQSPRHIEEFLFAQTVWREVGEARFDGLDLDAVIAQARAEHDAANVVAMADGAVEPKAAGPSVRLPVRATRSRRYRALGSIAAGLVLVAIGAGLASWRPWEVPAYSTAVGEQRSVRLEDGSLLQLNTHSRVEVRFSKDARELRLLSGEALFTVERDASRPFVVYSGDAKIRALGTEFNVYRRAIGTTVAVLSGAVQVTPADEPRGDAPATAPAARLDAGEQAHVESGQVHRTQPNVADVVAWRERRLVFRGERLQTVADEFNRYNHRQIRVEGDGARDKLLSGTFDADDPESLELFLRKLDDVDVESRDGGLTIRSR